MAEIEAWIKEVREDRIWYRERRLVIEASACAIREKALLDCNAAILRAKWLETGNLPAW